MFKFLVTLSIALLMVSSPACAQDENATPPAETEKIVPLFKMKKPELRIVYANQGDTTAEDPNTTSEDKVIAYGVQTKPDVKANDPIICRELTVPDFGRTSNGSRIRKTQKYCNHRSKWDAKQRNTLKIVKDATRM